MHHMWGNADAFRMYQQRMRDYCQGMSRMNPSDNFQEDSRSTPPGFPSVESSNPFNGMNPDDMPPQMREQIMKWMCSTMMPQM